jgi:biotin carboxyl carrier protein
MTFEIEVKGRTHVVTIDEAGVAGRSAGRFRVAMHMPDAGITGGVPDETDRCDVDARLTDLGVSVLFERDGRSVDAAVTDRGRGEYLVQFRAVSVAATVDGRRLRPGTPGTAAPGEALRVVAPMPGRIVRVLVRVGDEVAERQALVVVEAMKMENELVAARAGTVREIAVTEGVSVDAGRLLVRIE